MPRRSKLTPDAQKKIVQAIKLGATHTLAASYANITTTTLYNWLRAGREGRSPVKVAFFNAFKEAEASCGLSALAAIHRAHKDGSWQAAAWLLERRHGYTKNGAAAIEVEPQAKAVELTDIEQITKARKEAFASGSYVAGATLLREEGRMKAEKAAADVAAANAKALNVSDQDLLAEVVDLINTLPDGALQQIREMMDA